MTTNSKTIQSSALPHGGAEAPPKIAPVADVLRPSNKDATSALSSFLPFSKSQWKILSF
jgi:hypothetical protein